MTLEYDVRDTAGDQPKVRARRGRAKDLESATLRRGQETNTLTGTPPVLRSAPVADLESTRPRSTSASEVTVEDAMVRWKMVRWKQATTGGLELPATDDDLFEMVPDPTRIRTSAGTVIVHLHQHYRGIPVFEAVRSVHFDPGARAEILGDHVPIAHELEIGSPIPAADAVMAAVHYLAKDDATLKISPHPPRIIASFPLPSRPSVLAKPPFAEPVTAHLVWLHCGSQDTRLGWLVSLTTPDHGEMYDIIVTATGAESGEVLYCRGSYRCVQGRARVFFHNPDDPGGRVDADLPQPRDAYPDFTHAPESDPFGQPWIDRHSTSGNNATAFRGNRRAMLEGELSEDVVAFKPGDPDGEDQRLLNAFYHCNYLHDFFSLLGFGEAEGNFQRENFTGAEGDRDPLEIRIFDRPLDGAARMRSRRDGRPGELQLGLLGDRHSALDADLVCHEYAHGVTTRLAGGRLSFEPLRHPESRALGEGYSDYFAVTLRSHQLGEEQSVFGAWLAGDADKGLRRQAYDDRFSFHYGHLARPEHQQPHQGGEIWAAALIRLNRALGQELGNPAQGHELGWQLVIDSLKLLPVGPDQPGFLDARDAITRALTDLRAAGRLPAAESNSLEQVVQDVFTSIGMGPAATGRGARFRGIVHDFGDNGGASDPGDAP